MKLSCYWLRGGNRLALRILALPADRFDYVEVTPDLVAYLTMDAKDPELLWVLGFGSPPWTVSDVVRVGYAPMKSPFWRGTPSWRRIP